LELLTKRKEARKAKDYHLSDQLREAIHKEGYEVRDSGDEQELKKL
jgi:cysteinyl-tRNA synthetase